MGQWAERGTYLLIRPDDDLFTIGGWILLSAGITFFVMDANRAAAFQTDPFCVFHFHKALYPDFPDPIQVLDHAHPIFGDISLVEMF